MLPDLRTDLRDAARTLRRRPGFALLAVLTLAVGMSVNTVAFSVVNAILAEGLVLAALAGLLALSLSTASGALSSAFSLPAPIPQQINLSPDARSVGFTLLLVLAAGLLAARRARTCWR